MSIFKLKLAFSSSLISLSDNVFRLVIYFWSKFSFFIILSHIQPLQIKSAVAVEGLKGYIYIEAFKQQHVKQAIEDIGNLKIGKWQQLMVPIKEMTDVLRVVKDTTALKRGSWVRVKRSIYKDDIAQVS